MKKGIIFDVDGTLWDSAVPVAQSWNEVLKRRYPEVERRITPEDMYRNMGKTMDAIGDDLFPFLEPAKRTEVMEACMEYENEYLAAHPGDMYPHMVSVLSALSSRYALFIVSNCQTGYIEALMASCGIGAYVADTECFGATGRPKGDNIRLVMERNGLEKCFYVGDTAMDQEASRQAGIPFLYLPPTDSARRRERMRLSPPLRSCPGSRKKFWDNRQTRKDQEERNEPGRKGASCGGPGLFFK